MAVSSTTQWSDLPAELQEMIVERCDYLTRNSLRATSFSMNQLAGSSKLFIPSIRIKERVHGVYLDFTFRLWIEHMLKYEKDPGTGGTRIRQCGKEDIVEEDAQPMDLALEMFRKVCVSKNITIGYLMIETIQESNTLLAEKTRLMLETSGVALKIQMIHWNRICDSKLMFNAFLENCQPAHLKEVKIYGMAKEAIDLFANHSKVAEKLGRIEILGEVLATDKDVLALKASRIHLSSKEFTSGMVEKMLEKLTKEHVDGSFFMLKKPKEGLKLEHIPEGMEKIESHSRVINSYSKLLCDGKKRLLLKTGPFGVFAEIQKVAVVATDDVGDGDESTYNSYSEHREKCLKRVECSCQETRFWPDDDVSEYEDYDDDDRTDDSFEYAYDRFEPNGGIWSDGEDEELDEFDYEYDGADDDF